MYIKRMSLKNIRCFHNLNLEFASAGSSALLLGDNGDGKSTVLRCLAMGLCDESSAAALFRELTGAFVRRQPDTSAANINQTGIIEIDLDDTDGITYRITTQITALPNFERVTQRLLKIKKNGGGVPVEIRQYQKGFPWQRIFVVGYGPGLRTRGTMDYQKYLAVDAVYPLFRYDVDLQNVELIIRRLIDTARDRAQNPEDKAEAERLTKNRIQVLMAQLLDLKSPEDFLFTSTGVEVAGFWGTAGLSQLGDGYQATITWVLDLISWWFLTQVVDSSSDWELESIEGIVIIDEIEQHLHPKWQHRILPSLRERFPKVQFVVATHSPLVASGCKDVEVHLFEKGEQSEVKPYGWLAENVYKLMGLPESRSAQFTEDVLKRYKELDYKRLTETATQQELHEWGKLSTELSLLPKSDPIAVTLEMANIVETLKDRE